MVIYLIAFTLLSYLAGSFSSAVWYGKWFYKTDVREHGSKNAGATNTLRVLGAKAALPVFITDILKSYLSVCLVYLIPDLASGTEQFYQIKLLFGITAVIGHIFPVFSGFKGGKGVASMLGLVLALHPAAAGLSLLVFLLVFLSSRIVSISSISAAIVFPIIIFILEKTEFLTLNIFSIIAAVLIVITHLKNIKRLLKRQEKKISFKKKG
jgi:glycerol-3-phosphate acyltransferase PlsY